MIYMIGCMNLFHYIGKNNELLYHIPKDLTFFKKKTLNKVIVMGRKTFESLPRLLPNREHWVISSSGFSHPRVRTFSSIEECRAAMLEGYDYYIIGGGTIYRDFLKYCDAVYLTVVEDFKVGDTLFPYSRITRDFSLVSAKEDTDDKSGFKLEFRKYIKK